MDALNPAAEFDYSPRVRELFADLQHAGFLTGGVSAQAGSPAEGAQVGVQLTLQDGRIATARYQVYGCPHLLAACEMLAHWLEGRPVNELSHWRWRDVESELQVPASKRARLLLLDDVLHQLGQSVAQ